MKTAREIAIKALGTTKGITADAFLPNVYNIPLGDFVCKVSWDVGNCGLVEVTVKGAAWSTYSLYDALTLDEDFDAEDQRQRAERRADLENWVLSTGLDKCKEVVESVWNDAERR
jgi:hypothetical protein